MKKIITLLAITIMLCLMLVGCGRAAVDTASEVVSDISSGMGEAGDAIATDTDGIIGNNESTTASESAHNETESVTSQTEEFM